MIVMNDLNGQPSPGDFLARSVPADGPAVEIVWGMLNGLGPLWRGVPSGPGISGVLPPRSEIEATRECNEANSGTMRALARMARAFSAPTYRQRQGW